MPRKGRRARRNARLRATGLPVTRSGRGNRLVGSTLTYYPKDKTAFLLPPRLRTRMHSEIYGFTNSGMGSGDYSWGVWLNNIYRPWDTTSFGGFTPNDVTLSTLQPAGFTSICNASLYQAFRVIDSVISVDILPQSVQDGVVCSIVPTNALGAVVSGSMNQVFARTHQFASGRTNPTPSGMVNRMSVHKFLGVPASAIRDDLSFNYCGTYNSVPGKALFWNMAIETGDNSVLNSPLEIRIKLSWEVEFFGLQGAFLPLLSVTEAKEQVTDAADFAALLARIHIAPGSLSKISSS